MRFLFGLIGGLLVFLIEPAFVEFKFALVAYVLRQPGWAAILVGASGFLLIIVFVNAVAVIEGAKSLAGIRALVEEIPAGSARVADIIPDESLVSEYGYQHQGLRYGPFAQDAGKMTIFYDSSGTIRDYQCGFNLFGNSYLFTASGLPLALMPTMQRYLTLHEMGHGSMVGGGIWIRARWVIASGLLAGMLSLAVSGFGWLATFALALTALVTVVSSRPVVIESAAEEYAEIYAITKIARTDRAGAKRVVELFLRRLGAYDPPTKYDLLITKSRSKTLSQLRDFLSSTSSVEDANLNPIHSWPHYLAALLLAIWVFFYPSQHAPAPSLLTASFLVMILTTTVLRYRALPEMIRNDAVIRKRLNDDANT
jgi:hypothetical protein